MIMLPNGNGGFTYIPTNTPVYVTKYRDHGNQQQYDAALAQLREVLKNE
jgi:hypothetical protein